MPTAIPTSTTPRRALFRGTAALLAETVLPAACQGEAFAAPLTADFHSEPILALHRALLRQVELIQKMSDEDVLPPGPESDAYDERFEAVVAASDDLFDKIIVTPARTPAGRRAKADCLRMAFERTVCHGHHPTIATINDDGEWQEQLAWSLARDVLAEGSV